MPSNFPTISVLLREFVDYDISSGLRQTLSDLRSGWKNPYDKLASQQKTRMKKLSPEEKAAVTRLVLPVLENKVKNPEVRADTSVGYMVKQLNSRAEAEALLGGIKTMSVALQEINSMFIRNMEGAGYITQREAEAFTDHAKNLVRVNLGPKVLTFIQEHADKFMKILNVDENLLLNVSGAAALLRQAIEKTPKDGEEGRTRRDAILGTHYLLNALAVALNDIYKGLEQALRNKGAPDETAEPKPTKPTTPPADTSTPTAPTL